MTTWWELGRCIVVVCGNLRMEPGNQCCCAVQPSASSYQRNITSPSGHGTQTKQVIHSGASSSIRRPLFLSLTRSCCPFAPPLLPLSGHPSSSAKSHLHSRDCYFTVTSQGLYRPRSSRPEIRETAPPSAYGGGRRGEKCAETELRDPADAVPRRIR